MHEKSDAQLLREYAEQGTETAFREIVERHTDLIYSSALRQMSSPDLAHDVAQSVFTDLAHKSASLSAKLEENASLLGWLYRSTRFAALTQLRDERRRHARERYVMENSNPTFESAPEWERVGPVLDEAMADLSDEDREALLLRFFKNRDFRAIGTALGVSDDAAQKRVSRALEKLRTDLTRRSVTTTAVALSAALSVNAVQAAPAGLSAVLSSSAIAAGTASAAGLISVGKTLIMTTTQKTFITIVLVAAASVGIYEAQQSSTLRAKVQALEQQHQTAPADKTQQLIRERDAAKQQLAELREEIERLNRNSVELIKLRGEVARLRGDANRTNDPTQVAMKAWVNRVVQLKERLKAHPEASIPELNLMDAEDWLAGTKGLKLVSENDYRLALSALRYSAENKFAPLARKALEKFLKANENRFPTDMAQLREFFDNPIADEILQRWQIAPKKTVPNVGVGDWIITEKAAVDDVLDIRFAIGKNGYGSSDFLSSNNSEILQEVYKAAANANKDAPEKYDASDFLRLLSYATTPEEKSAIQKLIERKSLGK